MKKKVLGILLSIIVIANMGCAAKEERQEVIYRKELFGENKNAFGNVEAPVSFDWKQCDGLVLDFLVENNISADILSKECDKFTAVTGIKVNIRSMNFNTMVEKLNMEFISKTAQYELVYVDPYQTLNRFHESLEDLKPYETNPDLPHIVGGLDAFPKEQVQVCSFFENDMKLCAVPFDTTTMILFYRKDIFEKYRKEMTQDLGYDPIPGTSVFTWERYIEVGTWIAEHVPKKEVKYAAISASAEHNSIYTEFSNVLNAYGGNYFADENANSLGTSKWEALDVDSETFQKALDVYQRIAALNPEHAGQWNWEETAESFRKGEAAMMLNWDENAAAVENEEDSAVSGKVGYGILPYGEVRSANIYGGSGIGINSYISEEKKLASWMFIVWATSPQIQMDTFIEKSGGNMPTRVSLNHLITGQYMARFPQANAVITAQKKSFAYYRPKMELGFEFEQAMKQNLHKMIIQHMDVKDVETEIRKQWENAKKENVKE